MEVPKLERRKIGSVAYVQRHFHRFHVAGNGFTRDHQRVMRCVDLEDYASCLMLLSAEKRDGGE